MVFRMRTIIDITRPIYDGMPVWPGDPPVCIRPAAALPAVSQISLSTHAGTHVDPPAHFVLGGRTVDRLPLDILLGPAWVAWLPGTGAITAAQLAAAAIPPATARLLLRTANSERPVQAFDPAFVGLAPDAAAWLIDRGVRLVGIDGPSIEPFDAPGEPVHHALLATGIIVIEGLWLADVAAGAYELLCLPLRLAQGDGAPTRAVLVGDA